MSITLDEHLRKGETIINRETENTEMLVVIRVSRGDWHDYLSAEVEAYGTTLAEYIIQPE